jgi:hypothetical protein
MASLCYRRHRFPPGIIQHAIWLVPGDRLVMGRHPKPSTTADEKPDRLPRIRIADIGVSRYMTKLLAFGKSGT